MKTLFTALMLTLSFQLFAEEIVVYDAPTWETRNMREIRTTFDINKDLGRAWVSLVFVPHFTPEEVAIEDGVLVPGLSYNAATKEVVLDAAGERTVCANVKKNIFQTSAKLTKNCEFITEHYTVQRDTGFEIETIEMTKISLKF